MSSGPNIPDGQRKRPKLSGVTLAAEVLDALRRHCERTGESKSALVERALRAQLKMKAAEKW